MTVMTFTENGYLVVFSVPNDTPKARIEAFEAWSKSDRKVAPVDFLTGAAVAQSGAPVALVPPKGTGTGAVPAPLRPLSGAAVAPVPTGRGPRRTDAASRIEVYRTSLKALAQEKADLMPAADAHAAGLKEIRGLLRESHECFPLFGDPKVTAYRLGLHDRIVAVSEAYGPDARRYREVTAMIAALSDDVAKLERAKA